MYENDHSQTLQSVQVAGEKSRMVFRWLMRTVAVLLNSESHSSKKMMERPGSARAIAKSAVILGVKRWGGG